MFLKLIHSIIELVNFVIDDNLLFLGWRSVLLHYLLL